MAGAGLGPRCGYQGLFEHISPKVDTTRKWQVRWWQWPEFCVHGELEPPEVFRLMSFHGLVHRAARGFLFVTCPEKDQPVWLHMSLIASPCVLGFTFSLCLRAIRRTQIKFLKKLFLTPKTKPKTLLMLRMHSTELCPQPHWAMSLALELKEPWGWPTRPLHFQPACFVNIVKIMVNFI